jgi:hypothetical protein
MAFHHVCARLLKTAYTAGLGSLAVGVIKISFDISNNETDGVYNFF